MGTYKYSSNSATLTDLEVGDISDGTGLVWDETNNRLGINEASPGTALHVNDTTASSANTGGALRLSANDGAAMGDSHRLGVIEFTGAEDTSNTQTIGARIEALTDAAWTNAENGCALYFYTTDGNAAQTSVLKLDSNKKATFAGDAQVAGDLILDDGGSIKEAGGTAAITIDGDGNVTKIGQDSLSSGDVLTYDGAKWVGEAPTSGDITGVTAGTGLSGGGSSGAVTLNMTNTAVTVTAGDGLKNGGSVALGASVTLDVDVSDFAGDGLADDGSENLKLDLNGLSAGAVAVANDSIAIIDSDDNGSKKESIADFVSAIAGTGLTASSGQLSISETGDITGVTAGDGLTGGGTTGAVSLAVGAGTGIDVAADAISVDVSDFMANGADNYIVTATGSDAMNAEANLQFDGSTLAVTGNMTVSSTTTSSDAITVTKDTDGEFIALQLTNQSDANDTTGAVSVRFDLEDTGGNAVDAAKIKVVKEAAFTATASTQDASMQFMLTENGTLTERMTLQSDGDLKVQGDLILDDGGSIKEAGGTAAITISATGEVTKIGQDSPSDGHVLTWDNSNTKVVWSAASGGSMDINGLSAAAVSVGNDSIAIADADDSNATRKVSIADFVSAISGTGISASSGVMSLDVGASATGFVSGGVRTTNDQAGEILAMQVFS